MKHLHVTFFALFTPLCGPLLIAAPGISPGRSDSIVQLVDLFPTLCELTGALIPEGVEGRSLVPVLLDPTSKVHDEAFSYVGGGHHGLRTDRRAFMRYADGEEELCEMNSDPNQFTNLAKDPAHEATLAELRARLQSRLDVSSSRGRKEN